MKTLQHYSIKHRVIMFTLAVFVVSILSLSFYASRMLQEDMLNQLGGSSMQRSVCWSKISAMN